LRRVDDIVLYILFKVDTVQYTQFSKRTAKILPFSQRSFGEIHRRHAKIEIKMLSKQYDCPCHRQHFRVNCYLFYF